MRLAAVFALSWLCSWSAADALALPDWPAEVYADAVVSFSPGHPAARGKPDNRPQWTLGPPARREPALTLGCGGVLVLRFIDNALIDVAGDDLYVFEVGPDVEATRVDVSTDGRDWRYVGKVAGATASLDIHAVARPGEVFSYVRLTDLRQACDSTTPGADIDAVAAIGSVHRQGFAADVLFDFDRAELRPEARRVLRRWAASFNGGDGRLLVLGHTDSRGSEAYNLALSRRRAQAVARFLRPLLPSGLRIEARGLGESQLLVQERDEESAARNRRVELLYLASDSP